MWIQIKKIISERQSVKSEINDTKEDSASIRTVLQENDRNFSNRKNHDCSSDHEKNWNINPSQTQKYPNSDGIISDSVN